MDFRKTYISKHSPQAWYHAWTSENTLINPIIKIEVDTRIGGAFILHAELETEIRKMMGIFLELSPPKKLRYIWQWEGSEEATEVSVEFGNEQGETLIQLEHQGFNNSEESTPMPRDGMPISRE